MHLLRQVCLAFVFLAVTCQAVQKDGSDMLPRVELAVDDAEVVKAAKFAVEELRQLSDSGVFETLSLVRIVSAASQEGVYHFNTFLTLVLHSPVMKTKDRTSQHEVIVMENKEDGILSFAIDEFPVMEDDAVEAFWIQKVDRHREMREQLFAKLEAEYAKSEL